MSGGIGKIPPKIPPDLQRLLEQLKERLEVLSGNRGNEMDRAVTLRDLDTLGLVLSKTGIGGTGIGGGGGGGGGGTIDLTAPPQPVDLTTFGLFAGILLGWDYADYGNHGYTEIWRSETDSLGTAILIGTSRGKVYMDFVGDHDQYYYWVRLVSESGITGPYNASAGTPGQTALDPAYIVELLGDYYATQTLLEALRTQLTGGYLGGDLGEVNAGLLYQETQQRAQGYLALQNQLNALAVGVPSNLDTIKIWYFDSTTDGWVSENNATVSASNGCLVVDATGANPRFRLNVDLSPGINGGAYPLVRARVKRTAGSDWVGKMQWKTAGHGFLASYEAVAPNTAANDEWEIVEWDLQNDPDWNASLILNLMFELGLSAADDYIVDWIAVGRNAPSASIAALSEEAAARLLADSAEVTSRQLLQTKLIGNADPNTATLADITSGLIYDEKISRVTQDSALSQTISSVQATAVSKNRIYRQATQPSGQNFQEGDVWYNTSDNNIPYIYTNGAWVKVEDQRVLSNYNTLDARIINEAQARANADGALTTQITYAQSTADNAISLIGTEATTRANADATEAASRSLLSTKILGVADPTNATLQNLSSGLLYEERTARSTQDSSFTNSLSLLSSTVTNNYNTLDSRILQEATTRANADSSLATQISQVSATASLKNRVYRQSVVPAGGNYVVGDVWVHTGNNNLLYVWNGTTWVQSDDLRVMQNYYTLDSRITNEVYAITNPSGAIATQINTARVEWQNYANTAVQQEASARLAADGRIESKYTVKLETNTANGQKYIAGFGLIQTGNNEGIESAFVVSADRFVLTVPGYNLSVPPFQAGMVNGVYTVGIRGDVFIDGSITANAIHARTITADRIGAYEITGYEIKNDAIEARLIKGGVVEGRHINTETFTVSKNGMTVDISNARIQIYANGYYRILGVNFGTNSYFVDYFGTQPAASASESNAKFFIKNDGSAMFGGRVRGEFEPKCWGRFYYSGGPIILDRFNVGSITRTAIGTYSVTFASPLPNNNYAAVVTGSNTGSSVTSPTVNGFTVISSTAGGDRIDPSYFAFVVFGSNVVSGSNVSSPTGGYGGGTYGGGNIP